jgi:NTP pyrophosphatase (non-canonical NTP hydrolase)
MPDTRMRSLCAVLEERDRQDAKWGQQDHDILTWIPILGEEYGELCEAALALQRPELHRPDGKHEASVHELRARVRHELVQVTAVGLAAIEAMDRSEP